MQQFPVEPFMLGRYVSAITDANTHTNRILLYMHPFMNFQSISCFPILFCFGEINLDYRNFDLSIPGIARLTPCFDLCISQLCSLFPGSNNLHLTFLLIDLSLLIKSLLKLTLHSELELF